MFTIENKPGTAQVGAIFKAQKIEGGVFWRQKNFAKKSHSAEKTRKGDPSLSSGSVGYVKKSKKPKGDPLVTKKFEKVAQCRKKIGRGTLLCFPGRPFVSFFVLHKVLRFRVFWTSTFWTFPKLLNKWTERKSGPFVSKKRTTHCKSRAHFLLKCADKKHKIYHDFLSNRTTQFFLSWTG